MHRQRTGTFKDLRLSARRETLPSWSLSTAHSTAMRGEAVSIVTGISRRQSSMAFGRTVRLVRWKDQGGAKDGTDLVSGVVSPENPLTFGLFLPSHHLLQASFYNRMEAFTSERLSVDSGDIAFARCSQLNWRYGRFADAENPQFRAMRRETENDNTSSN